MVKQGDGVSTTIVRPSSEYGAYILVSSWQRAKCIELLKCPPEGHGVFYANRRGQLFDVSLFYLGAFDNARARRRSERDHDTVAR